MKYLSHWAKMMPSDFDISDSLSSGERKGISPEPIQKLVSNN